MIDAILILLGLLGLFIASICDIKTKEIPDWLSFSLIASGISIRIMQAVSAGTWKYLVYTLLIVFAMLVLGNVMYYTKQWGGGDTKLLIALAAVFAVNPYQEYFFLSMLINLVIVSTAYGLAFCIYFAFRYRKKFIKELPIYYKKESSKIKKFILIAVLLLVPVFIIKEVTLIVLLATAAILLSIYPLLTTFIEAVERSAMFREIKVSKLTEGDWITKDIRVKNKLIYSKSAPGIEKFQINLLKKFKIKYVPVKDGIPFVPAFFISAVLTLIFGNLLLVIYQLI